MKVCTIVETRPEVINRFNKKIENSKLNNPALETYLYNGASSRIENILLMDL